MSKTTLSERVQIILPPKQSGRYDLSIVFNDFPLFSEISAYLAEPFRGKVDAVASPEALGWLLGIAVARELQVGFVPIRKAGKLPDTPQHLIAKSYTDSAGESKALQILTTSFEPGKRILLVDEWIASGRTVECSLELLHTMGASLVGIAAVIVDQNERSQPWLDKKLLHYICLNEG